MCNPDKSKFYYDPKTMATKVKIFGGVDINELENEINEFIKDKILIDIKYNTEVCDLRNQLVMVDRVIVMYRDFPF